LAEFQSVSNEVPNAPEAELQSVNGAALGPQELVARIERLLEEIERLPDPAGREKATEVVQALFDLYGAGLERIVDKLAARDDGELAAALAGDELISHLLLLHGLHPVALEQRVISALDEVRPYLESHGGNVELLGVGEDRVRLLLKGSCSGCPSSTMTLKLAIENAIHKAAPEIEEVVAEEETASEAPLLQIELAPSVATLPNLAPTQGRLASASDAALDGEWMMAGGLPELAGGGLLVKQVGGQAVLFLRASGRLYGYRPSCPACEQSLHSARLEEAEIRCEGCGNRYDVLRAGRCLDSPQLHLEPVPLLVSDDGLVKVALPVAA
jgi:Fe-S cluster biogenesis protein NfuA/nitrite reductase/ring-hydroxylating ferredoxin subunit